MVSLTHTREGASRDKIKSWRRTWRGGGWAKREGQKTHRHTQTHKRTQQTQTHTQTQTQTQTSNAEFGTNKSAFVPKTFFRTRIISIILLFFFKKGKI